MPHPERPFDDEAVLRTDEQAGTPGDQLKRAEREFDPNNPPSAQPQNQKKKHTTTFRQTEQLRTDEGETGSQAVRDAYSDS